VRSVADATCSRRVIPEQVITYLGCNRYPAGVSISPRIRAAGRLSTPSICLKDCALASIAKEPHPTLIGDLATIVKNRIQPTNKNFVAFEMLTDPSVIQQRALDLLGVTLRLN
jgi:hypothetical protein